jgi:gamma-glutamylputrescine oxidase
MNDRAFHPGFLAQPYWWEAAPPETARDEALPSRA